MSEQRILIVEDDVDLNQVLESILVSKLPAYSISVAENGFEAMDLIKRDSFALVITDLSMPECDGGRLHRLVSEYAAEESLEVPPFIFCSGVKASLDHVAEVATDPRNRFILKPYSIGALLDAIFEILEIEG